MLRALVLVAHAGFGMVLVFTATQTFLWQPPSTGPLADWAGFDRMVARAVGITIAGVAAFHAILTWLWWTRRLAAGVIVIPAFVSVVTVLIWLAYERADLPGLLVFTVAAVAATLSIVAQLAQRRGAQTSTR